MKNSPPQPVTGGDSRAATVDLELKGRSGTAEQPLFILKVNQTTRTCAVGEEMEVPTSSGPVRIRVVESKSDSVVVLANGERRVLRFRAGF